MLQNIFCFLSSTLLFLSIGYILVFSRNWISLGTTLLIKCVKRKDQKFLNSWSFMLFRFLWLACSIFVFICSLLLFVANDWVFWSELETGLVYKLFVTEKMRVKEGLVFMKIILLGLVQSLLKLSNCFLLWCISCILGFRFRVGCLMIKTKAEDIFTKFA